MNVLATIFKETHFNSGLPPAVPCSKRHSRREEASKEEIFSKVFLIYIFLVIPWSWGVHRYPWFENRSVNMAREEAYGLDFKFFLRLGKHNYQNKILL